MPRPIRAVVRIAAISSNINTLRSIVGQRVLMPVVKANAYGHGLERIYPGLEHADALAILELDGAEQLRTLGWTKPIVLLEGCFDEADLQKALSLKCDWVIHRQGQLDQLKTIQGGAGQHMPRIFLKINTGMNRLGFQMNEAPAAIEWLDNFTQAQNWPTPVLMTHFANADEATPRNRQPRAENQHSSLASIKPAHWQSSLGNSAGCLLFPEISGDIVRPGISIYGATPGPASAAHHGLKPAMTFSSQIIAIQSVKPGERVGYGSRWEVPHEGRIAVVACGYADGYPRHAPDGTPTWVEGHTAPVAGRVSMDMMTVDITHIPTAKIGSTVELWGENLPVDVVAERCGTIGYELLCAVAPRVPMHTV